MRNKPTWHQEVAIFNVAEGKSPYDKNRRLRTGSVTVLIERYGLLKYVTVPNILPGVDGLDLQLTEKGVQWVKDNPPGQFSGRRIPFLFVGPPEK